MTRCAKCGCQISSYAMATDRYCWPCHPRIEASRRDTCPKGHDLQLHGVIAASGAGRSSRRCKICKAAYDREQSARRRQRQKGKP